ncbi:MAG: methyltransferase family protein [Candidatus Odinarchaeota archaeon]
MVSKDDSLRISSRSDHEGREDLIGEHPYGDTGQVVCLVIFLIVWVLDSFLFKLSIFLAASIPLLFRLGIAFIILLTGCYLAGSGLRIVFKEVRDPPSVIRKGVFAHTRHPIYLAAMFVYLASVIATISLVSLLLLVLIFIFYNYIASYEEKMLVQKFGQEYLEYKKIVPKWRLRLKTAKFEHSA